MGLKMIALDSGQTVDELNEFKRGNNDGLREESADPDAGKESWVGAIRTADFLGAWRAEMRLQDDPDPVQIQNGH